MKTLSTEQQEELQEFFQALADDAVLPLLTIAAQAQIGYWSLELKPKRIRKKTLDKAVEV